MSESKASAKLTRKERRAKIQEQLTHIRKAKFILTTVSMGGLNKLEAQDLFPAKRKEERANEMKELHLGRKRRNDTAYQL
jgi:hypothetical protein